MRCLLPLAALVVFQAGCMAFPDVVHEPTYHNPFPQLSRVAVLPFNNLSGYDHIHPDQFALAYYNELQKIPGFVVTPMKAVNQVMLAEQITVSSPSDLRALAKRLNVDAVVVGAVTEFDPYYPPRLGLAVDWYAANPGFHPIPPGYGLPWGTADEEYIPERLVHEAEFALAQAQLRTQTPDCAPVAEIRQAAPDEALEEIAAPSRDVASEDQSPEGAVAMLPGDAGDAGCATGTIHPAGPALPPGWPDPRGFMPPPPSATRRPCVPHDGPIIEHVRIYDGKDNDLTTALANYYYLHDDARFTGWQPYLQRSDDFIRFCCHLHITQMLAARGGAGKTRVVWRWPIGRYER